MGEQLAPLSLRSFYQRGRINGGACRFLLVARLTPFANLGVVFAKTMKLRYRLRELARRAHLRFHWCPFEHALAEKRPVRSVTVRCRDTKSLQLAQFSHKRLDGRSLGGRALEGGPLVGFDISLTLPLNRNRRRIDRASRVELALPPTCLTGQGGYPKGDAAGPGN